MADINVERKGPSIWPWIIGLIVLALIIWAVAELMDEGEVVDTEPVGVVEEPMATPPPVPAADTTDFGPGVEQFLTMCAEGTAPVTADHRYTSGCIDQLATALDSVVVRPEMAGIDLQAQVDDLHAKADLLVESPNESEAHAGMAREAFVSATTLLDDLQDERFPDLEASVERLSDAAESIDTEVPLTEQSESVDTFFGQAGDLLRAMSTSTGA